MKKLSSWLLTENTVIRKGRAPKLSKKGKKAAVAKSEATKNIFGDDGQFANVIVRMFKALDREAKKAASKQSGVSAKNINTDRIVLNRPKSMKTANESIDNVISDEYVKQIKILSNKLIEMGYDNELLTIIVDEL